MSKDNIPSWAEHNLHQRIKRKQAVPTTPTPHSDSEQLDEILGTLCLEVQQYGATPEQFGYAPTTDQAKAAILRWADRRAEKLVVEIRAYVEDNTKEVRLGSDVAWTPIVNAEDLMPVLEEKIAAITVTKEE